MTDIEEREPYRIEIGKHTIGYQFWEKDILYVRVLPACRNPDGTKRNLTVADVNEAVQVWMNRSQDPPGKKSMTAYLNKEAVLEDMNKCRDYNEELFKLFNKIKNGDFDTESIPSDLVTQLHIKDAEITRLKFKLAPLESNLGQIQRFSETAIKNANEEIAQLKAANEDWIKVHKSAVGAFNDENIKNQNQILKMKSRIAQYEKDQCGMISEILSLKGRIVDLEKLCDMQKTTLDQQGKALREALETIRHTVPCDGCHPKPCSGCQWELERCKYRRLAKGDHHCRYFKEHREDPAQKEPELFICPESCVCKPSTCFHRQPHTHGSGCMRPSDTKCHICSDCAPIKKSVPQPSPVPTSGTGTALEGATVEQIRPDDDPPTFKASSLAILRISTLEDVQYQNHKRIKKLEGRTYPGMAKDIGDLTLRVDNLTSGLERALNLHADRLDEHSDFNKAQHLDFLALKESVKKLQSTSGMQAGSIAKIFGRLNKLENNPILKTYPSIPCSTTTNAPTFWTATDQSNYCLNCQRALNYRALIAKGGGDSTAGIENPCLCCQSNK
jgi:hypothetical protein